MGKELDRVKPKDPERWFADAITAGIKQLYVLSLPGTPGSDAIASTTGVWINVLWKKNVGWNKQLDTERLAMAFEGLLQEMERWPAPKQLMEYLPKREAPKAVEPVLSPEKIAENRRVLEEMSKRLKQGYKTTQAMAAALAFDEADFLTIAQRKNIKPLAIEHRFTPAANMVLWHPDWFGGEQ